MDRIIATQRYVVTGCPTIPWLDIWVTMREREKISGFSNHHPGQIHAYCLARDPRAIRIRFHAMTEPTPPASITLKLTQDADQITMEFRWIPPGWFRMGERGVRVEEEPPTWVQISQGFYMATLPATVEQYHAVIADDKKKKRENPNLPVENFSWAEAQKFCEGLAEACKQQFDVAGRTYRVALPTEAQWEYACRAGTDTETVFGDGQGVYRERIHVQGAPSNHELVLYMDNSGLDSRDPKIGIPNPFGLRDTHGNLSEWCQDPWDSAALRRMHPGIDETAASELVQHHGLAEDRVLRGGSWGNSAEGCRAAFRFGIWAVLSNRVNGLRACLVPSPDPEPASNKQPERAVSRPSGEARRQAAAEQDGLEAASPHQEASAQPARDFLEPLIMPSRPTQPPILVIESSDGKTWNSNIGLLDGLSNLNAIAEPDLAVKKLVIGTPPTRGAKAAPISWDAPKDLAALFPELTHLYLWQIENLTELPRLPAGMKVIDVRGCGQLASWGDQPNIASWSDSLEELFVDDTAMPAFPMEGVNSFPKLIELSIRGCTNWSGPKLNAILRKCPVLRYLDASDCATIQEFTAFPAELRVIKLNGCSMLESLPVSLPTRLRRLELRGATSLDTLPTLTPRVDYLDLRDTIHLRQIPTFASLKQTIEDGDPVPLDQWDSNFQGWHNGDWIVQKETQRPRTLYLYGSGMEIPNDLKGTNADDNVALVVMSDLLEQRDQPSQPLREVKVILLGNGRSGKSSLANVWAKRTFDEHESTTHGIRLWKLQMEFKPESGPRPDESEQPRVNVNVWDFAGQDLYHGTHRGFLQDNAIYLILCSSADHPGHDDDTDQTEKVREREEQALGIEDRPRSPRYWYDMVQSLGIHPQTQKSPPVLFVHTKWDRGHERNAQLDLPVGHQAIPFSAKKVADALKILAAGVDPANLAFDELDPPALRTDVPGLDLDAGEKVQRQQHKEYLQGFQRIVSWVRQQARALLGPDSRHSVPKSVIRVINEIKELADQNDQAYEARDRARATKGNSSAFHCVSPHPTISRELFNQWVAKECKHYYPDTLLKRLHDSGLIFYDRRSVGDQIIIDQRWAIHGFYVLLDRSKSSFLDQIHRSEGMITKSALERCWTENPDFHYTSAHCILFREFLRSCGMYFEYLPANFKRDEDPTYAFPGFYPTRASRIEREATSTSNADGNSRHEIVDSIASLEKASQDHGQFYRIENVNESEVRALLSKLGQSWHRRLRGYRWGCSILDTQSNSLLWVDWKRPETGEQNYAHPLDIKFYHDAAPDFRREIRDSFFQVFQASRGWGEEKFSEQWRPVVEPSPLLATLPSLSTEEKQFARVGIRIALSYAGSGREDPSSDWGDSPPVEYQPSKYLGEIPRRLGSQLVEELSSMGSLYREVIFYEHPSSPQQLTDLIEGIAKSDAVIVFLSRKYLMMSEYCMAELLGLYRCLPGDCFPSSQVLFFDVVEKYHRDHSPAAYRTSDCANAGFDLQIWKSGWDAKLNLLKRVYSGRENSNNGELLVSNNEKIANWIDNASKLARPISNWWRLIWYSSFDPDKDQKLQDFFRKIAGHGKAKIVNLPDAVSNDAAVEKHIQDQVTAAMEIVRQHLTQYREVFLNRQQALRTLRGLNPSSDSFS
jgi:formylglycine-generating enzyme required for sulfatase activity/GTPase SAR1 family protein